MSIERLSYLTTRYNNGTATLEEQRDYCIAMKEVSSDPYKWHYKLQDVLRALEVEERERVRVALLDDMEQLALAWIEGLKVLDKSKISDLRKLDDLYLPIRDIAVQYKKRYDTLPTCSTLNIVTCCGTGRSAYNNLCKKCYGKGFTITVKEEYLK